LLILISLCPFTLADSKPRPSLTIPRLTARPRIEDFLDMKPAGDAARQMTRAEGFIQREPRDGEPASQQTQAYIGYDDENIYVAAICFDEEPDRVRARLSRRENAFGDDFVEVTFDTFQDERRGYVFWSNPLGVQADALWTESAGRPDFSFDTLWHSEGKLTGKGYVILMSIPFKSLRFPSSSDQNWGIVILRHIPRSNEWSYWPRVSSRIEGRLNQSAHMGGMQNISPGRNIQLIPYGSFRFFRALDTRDEAMPHFTGRRAEFDGGLDAKFVVRDSFVVDVALNPDFSQVESDEPQLTSNQRFEVFFPEKRPFFLENANYFQTPINLVFTRRIADPQLGVRVTGKRGPYSLGAMLIDDESPGKQVAESDPLSDRRAYFGIFRASRDILKQSSVGVIYTDRRFEGSYNRVAGVDAHLKLNSNWSADLQAATSSTRYLDNSESAGPAYEASLAYSDRQLFYRFEYTDRSPGFATLAGFNPRTDIRQTMHRAEYRFRPEGKRLIAWGPSMMVRNAWDHDGTRLDAEYAPSMEFEFNRGTSFSLFYVPEKERLRPVDFPSLAENRDYSRHTNGIFFRTSYFSQLSVNGVYLWGTKINFSPADGQQPELARRREGNLTMTLRPVTPLRIENRYIFLRLLDRATDASIFNNHILRSNINWQFSRELSLRAILQYNALLANDRHTSLETEKNFNADLLLTYQVNPWTVLYAGYNSNLQNIDLVSVDGGTGIVRRRDRFINDGRQFFVKFSYLFRF
jgi:hypothetical protein